MTIRHFEKESDMELQYDFWKTVTANLPYAWKPTLSPRHFRKQKEFDSKTRCFAFDGEQLVGHMGFTGEGNFVSFGYPWVLEGYEGVLQEEMYERIYHYAIGPEHGGKVLAQRFRAQWTDQIAFFKRKGFEVTGRSPIYGRIVSTLSSPDQNGFNVKIEPGFNIETFLSIAKLNTETTEQDLSFYRTYYASVDFDFAVACVIEDKIVAYFGVTIRQDTGYSEVVASIWSEGYSSAFQTGLTTILNELVHTGANIVGIYEAAAPKKEELSNLSFEKITDDVMMMKHVE